MTTLTQHYKEYQEYNLSRVLPAEISCILNKVGRNLVGKMKFNRIFHLAKKLFFFMKSFKDTVNHQYGLRLTDYLRFFYCSFLRINTFIVFENDLSQEISKLEIDSDFQIIKPTLEQLEQFRKGKNLPREFYCDKMYNAKNCYLVLHGNELAYIHWVFFNGDRSRFLKLEDDKIAELNYNTTLLKFRGRRLSAKVMSYISKDLQQLGYSKVVGVIHEDNIPSTKCIRMSGFREINKIKTIGRFHRKLTIAVNDNSGKKLDKPKKIFRPKFSIPLPMLSK